MKPNTENRSMNAYKTLLITLVTLFFSGCVVGHNSVVRLPNDQERLISEIASTRDDGSPREPINQIFVLVTAPGGPNPPGKTLFVEILVDVAGTGPMGLLGLQADPKHRAESECIRIINNFRKAGLSSEFSQLFVSAELPQQYQKANFFSLNMRTFCSFVITREELMNGSPPRQGRKNFNLIK